MIEILYKDKYLTVCIKPAGILSQSDLSGDDSLPKELSKQLKTDKIFTVHRLDRPVYGLIVYAFDYKTAANLSENDSFSKIYTAYVSGKPEKECGEFTDYIFKDSKKKKSFAVKTERKGAKFAALTYETLKTIEKTSKYGEKLTFSAVKIKLKTGRTHQIRVQFSSRQMSCVGDGKYGSRVKAETMGLFATEISFIHPVTKEKLQFKIPPLYNIEDISV